MRISRILKTIEDKGAISREKNPDDGRSVIIKLTEYGKEMREISKNSVYQFNNVVRDHVTEGELENILEVIKDKYKIIYNKIKGIILSNSVLLRRKYYKLL